MKIKGIPGILLSAVLLAGSSPVIAQSETNPDGNILISRAKYGFATLHSGGFGLGYVTGKYVDGYRMPFLEAAIVTMSHPKEVRSANPYYQSGNSYIFGKLNYVFIPRVTFGMQKLLNDEPYWGGIEVSYLYKAGLSCALTKPVYLVILHYISDPFTYTKSVEAYDPDIHYPEIIYGRGPFLKGFDKLGFYPGFHAEAALSFEFSEYDEAYRALEAGFSLDLFPRPVPIMAHNPASWYMLSFHISIGIGKRYH